MIIFASSANLLDFFFISYLRNVKIANENFITKSIEFLFKFNILYDRRMYNESTFAVLMDHPTSCQIWLAELHDEILTADWLTCWWVKWAVYYHSSLNGKPIGSWTNTLCPHYLLKFEGLSLITVFESLAHGSIKHPMAIYWWQIFMPIR